MKLNNIFCIFFSVLLSFGCGDTLGDQPEKNLSISELKEKLSERFPDSIEIVSIKEVDIEGYLEVNLKGIEPLFISKDGKYLISGDIYEITEQGLVNRSEARRNYLRKVTISELDESEFIIFKPNKVEHSVFVFTDVDCGYCRQFHREINDYLDLGIQVNYLAFPRAGIDSESYKKVVSAWCSSQPNQAITELKLGYEIKE
ncbi:MAG: disulfide isomerase DsbC N-terminal domain-containing protein, partial [Pseudomonadota bacterium]|nr:disulfide isomerase DsbC N-terminal domain-containing protein [Pseudomonadota bacterium]